MPRHSLRRNVKTRSVIKALKKRRATAVDVWPLQSVLYTFRPDGRSRRVREWVLSHARRVGSLWRSRRCGTQTRLAPTTPAPAVAVSTRCASLDMPIVPVCGACATATGRRVIVRCELRFPVSGVCAGRMATAWRAARGLRRSPLVSRQECCRADRERTVASQAMRAWPSTAGSVAYDA